MPILVWGSEGKSVDLGPAGTEACPTCGQERPYRWTLDYRRHHVYYLFGFVTKKRYRRICEVCRQGQDQQAAAMEAALGKSPIPFMERVGCLAALGAVAALVLVLALFTPFFREPRNVPRLVERAVQGDAKAVARLRAEADAGDLPSQLALMELATGELGPPADWGEAYRRGSAAAKAGNARAQQLLGWMLQRGLGCPVDPAAALEWYRKAETQGNAAAASAVGAFYLQGIGVPADPAEATRHFRKAAEGADPSGCYNLAWRYLTGVGAAADGAEGRRWLERAAATEDPSPSARTVAALALYNLGQMDEEGVGGEKDLVRALKRYEEASPRNTDARAAFERLKARLGKE